ncbi:hypothetical protein OIDMADRAFT_61513 [Oidiodendron maius Zn]|uniref:Uncharacterized protein n=1 Tax=Oidiodendron maius (strain Zn) TaxID=913774 RepID=A0A0C3GBM8_OIDMZ|nr:hypothetical protein OIDMADRAFT_61513 [Oidiodendron maius Zn]
MEVSLRRYKGMEHKPKATAFLFQENSSPSSFQSHILTRAIRDEAILLNGYRSATTFFATKPTSTRDKSYESTLQVGVVEVAGLSYSVRPMGVWEMSKTVPMPSLA